MRIIGVIFSRDIIRNTVVESAMEVDMYNYKNPFAEYNTNIMSSEQISELFAEPFVLFTIPESDITSDKSSIVFIGGRGTGKTMLLRQFSYNVQMITIGSKTFLEKVRKDKYIGIYFRVDNPLLRSLDAFKSSGSDSNLQESVFTHYFELTIFKDYLEVVKILLNDANIKSEDSRYSSIVTELFQMIPKASGQESKDIDGLLRYVIRQINYIWEFQSQKAIDIDDSLRFNPECSLILQGRLTNEFCNSRVLNIIGLDNIVILLLIDEFENFSERQQMVLNAAMRFTKDCGARLRIGMRPNGFKTYATLSSEEFIKVGRDYKKVEIGNPLVFKSNDKLYPELIKKIAEKRLALVPMFNGKCIVDFLGQEENLEAEAKSIVGGKTIHFDVYLKEIKKAYGDEDEDKVLFTMKSLFLFKDENPLFEMECLRLLLNGKSIAYVKKALSDYKNHVKSEESKKFSDDYDRKYKLSFVFVLCSIYRREKKGYYGFVDYCHLSSGIIGCFLELCRRVFDLAFFKESEALYKGEISSELQTEAAYEYAYSERDMIQRIAKFGSKLQIFVNNIGNVFSYIHKDLYIRYPETNQFPLATNLSMDNKSLLDLACMWSLVIKKPNVQDINGKNNKQDMYVLSRVFAPVFKISYRTRGGFSPIKSVTDKFFNPEFNPQSVLKDKKYEKGNANRLSLFDFQSDDV
jgi:hypothetical protein